MLNDKEDDGGWWWMMWWSIIPFELMQAPEQYGEKNSPCTVPLKKKELPKKFSRARSFEAGKEGSPDLAQYSSE